ncbi:MAG: T9SS type A sorting domain-containing protein [Sporocytophaga sp.]|uniref:T9SS type A sorting domain-containing protein n=1 Tax=Sporocytophaga sp. TaxID=2231183 RepID=UPI001B00C0C2|nr:T9SS type A sorting domain-containing protein [Sporocytophaga sp.]MBO9703764.1 T9SS type A sorting domain-containing protein [Sporocytophaga sp.]
MRKFLPLFFLILSLNSYAQFKTIHSDGTTYFKSPENFQKMDWGITGSFIPVSIESTRLVNEDTLYDNFRIFKRTDLGEPECIISNRGYAWTGKNIIMTKDQQEIFINSNDDSLIFKKYANVNDSWIFFQTEQNHFLATVIGKGLETFNIYEDQVTDSVLTITVSLNKNEDNSPLSHPFNGREWKISKKYGFVKTYDILHFPEDTNSLLLAGVDQFNIGVKNITEKEIYDFEVDDEFHIEEYSIYAGEIVENKIRQIILEKSFSNDSIVYQMEVLENKTKGSIYGGEEIFTVHLDTILIKVALTPDLNGINQIPLKKNEDDFEASYNSQFLRLGDPSVMIKRVNDGSYSRKVVGDSCYQEMYIIPSMDYYREYAQGLGGPYYNLSGDILSKDSRQLVYYKKGTIEKGKPLDLVLGLYPNMLGRAVSLSPNPAKDRIKISIEGVLNTYYKIYNNEGREVLNGSFPTNEESIDITSLREGIYSVMILKEGGVLYISRFVKN